MYLFVYLDRLNRVHGVFVEFDLPSRGVQSHLFRHSFLGAKL